jgi:nicotinamide mononucleotide adenylyltransferase
MTDIGVIHGRFQIFHNDHLKYVLAGKSQCSHLVIGITNPDPALTRHDPSDLHRSLPATNPLTYFERYTMVRAALVESGSPEPEFSIVPFPINFPELYQYYVPGDAVFYLTIYDDWGRKKLEQFRLAGLTTEILWERPPALKGLSAGAIRRRIATGLPWEHMVPSAVASLIHEWAVPERIRNIACPETWVEAKRALK